jgi:small subunit ribosomal protein S8
LAEGFISGVQVVGTTKKLLQITLKYVDGQSVINGIKRVSKPGQRIYVPSDKLPHTSSGFGVSVVSTSQGLLTDKQARKAKVGGEVMCQVW